MVICIMISVLWSLPLLFDLTTPIRCRTTGSACLYTFSKVIQWLPPDILAPVSIYIKLHAQKFLNKFVLTSTRFSCWCHAMSRLFKMLYNFRKFHMHEWITG